MPTPWSPESHQLEEPWVPTCLSVGQRTGQPAPPPWTHTVHQQDKKQTSAPLSFCSAGSTCYRSWSLLSNPYSSVEYSFCLPIPCVRLTILPVSKAISSLLVLTFPHHPQLLPEPSFKKKLLRCLCKQPGPSQRGSGEKMRNAPPIRMPFLPIHHLFKASPFARAKSAASLSTETWSFVYFSVFLLFHKHLSWSM